MQELTFDQVEMVSGGLTTGLFDSIGGLFAGAIAGALNTGAFAYIAPNKASCGIAGLLAPAQAVLGGAVGLVVGLIGGAVSGIYEGTAQSMDRLDAAWEVMYSNSI